MHADASSRSPTCASASPACRQRVGVRAGLAARLEQRARLVQEPPHALAVAAVRGDRRGDDAAPGPDVVAAVRRLRPLEHRLGLAVSSEADEDEREPPPRVHRAPVVAEAFHPRQRVAQDRLGRREIACEDLDVGDGDEIGRRGLRKAERLDDRVVLGHERARLVEGALHRTEIGEPAERRGAGVLVGRLLEDRQNLALRGRDRPPPAPDDHAQPARGEPLEVARPGRARVRRRAPEILLRTDLVRRRDRRAAVARVVGEEVRTREPLVVPGGFEHGDRAPRVGEHPLGILRREAPEAGRVAGDEQPRVHPARRRDRELPPPRRGSRGRPRGGRSTRARPRAGA